MARVVVNDAYLTDIADAIRDKLNTEDTYTPAEMADAIESITGTVNNQNKTVHPSTSQQSIEADSGYSGLGTVTVKGVTIENLSSANIVSGVTVKIGDADDDDSIASVTGSAGGGGITPTGTKQISITSNGTTTEDVTNYANAEITVNVSGGSGYNINDLATNTEPSGSVTITSTSIASYALINKKITSVSAPNATTLNTYCLHGNPLASASFPSVTNIVGGYVFGSAHTFTTIDGNMFPNLETCNINMLNGDTKTTSITLPKWTGLGYTSANATNQFRQMTKLVTLNLPECVHIGGYECYQDAKLETVLLGKTSTYTNAKYIRTHAFDGCTVFNVLVLYGNIMWTLSNIDAFANSPFASGKAGGTLYVPNDMITTYQGNSNWATILGYTNNTIAKIEGSIYE